MGGVCQTTKNYDYSRPFDVWKASEAPEVNGAVKLLFAELRPLLEPLASKKPEKVNGALKKVVLDLYIAFQDDPNLFVAYSRNEKNYRMDGRYKKLHVDYEAMIAVVDALAGAGYIEHVKGFNDRARGILRQSRMCANQELIDLIESRTVDRGMISRKREEIELRDESKRRIGYDDTPDTMNWRINVQKFNEALVSADVSLDLSKDERERLADRLGYLPDNSNSIIFRVFNNNFSLGGRFYGHWVQNLPSEYRKRLLIDGEKTVELDYSGLHINILYRLAGRPLPDGDVYAMPDPSLRPVAKCAMLIMLNAESRQKTIGALMEEEAVRRLKLKRHHVEQIVDVLIERHAPIKRDFNSGVGRSLQNIDSQLAERVMLSMTQKGVVCIPIHDSFIVKECFETDLLDSMREEFFNLFKADIKISKKHA